MDSFIQKFSGISESFFFYNGTVEIRFDEVEHKYFLVDPELGNLIPVFNVSTVSKIVDRSNALIPWTAKVTIEKLLRIIPTFIKKVPKAQPVVVSDGPIVGLGTLDTTEDVSYVPEMTLAQFSEFCQAAKTAHSDKLEDAGDVGKMAHRWIEQYIRATLAGDQVSIQGLMTQMCKDPRATNCVLAALGWIKAHNVRWIETERKVFSKKHKCSGTLDGLCLVDSCDDPLCCPSPFKDKLTIADWKTSNYLYVEFLFQTAAYEAFYEEEFGVDITDRWVLRLGKEDGEFQPWHLGPEDFPEDFAGFLACLHLKEIVDSVEGRMSEQKAHLRAERKRIREIQKAEDKAAEKVRKAVEKAQKKIDRENAKAAARAERERLKAEIKAEKAKLKTELKEEKKRAKLQKQQKVQGPETPEVQPRESMPSVSEKVPEPAPKQAEPAIVEAPRKLSLAVEESVPEVHFKIPQEG